MSARTIVVTVLALVFGLGAVFLVNAAVTNRNAANGAGGPTVDVLVAAVDIPRGATLTPTLFASQKFPKDLAPTGALNSADEAIDRAAFYPFVKGEPILDAKLTAKGTGRGLAAMVPPGMRAITIQTPNVASGIAGFVMPGNRVDVLLTVTDTGGVTETNGGGTTTTLLQNIEILAVDQNVDAPASNKVDVKDLRSVTLIVTPDQAAQLDLGQNKGVLHLTLRNIADSKTATTRPARLADLRFRQEKAWDERAKDVLGALGKALASATPRQQTKAVEAAPPQQPAPQVIAVRTLRGRSEGISRLQVPGRKPEK